jgi:hypothetical protein
MSDAIGSSCRRAVPEISRGRSSGGDEDYPIPKRLFLCRAAFRISWLLVFVLRNGSTPATPLDLTYGGASMAISRLVTEGDGPTSEQDPKFVCEGARLYFLK